MGSIMHTQSARILTGVLLAAAFFLASNAMQRGFETLLAAEAVNDITR